MKTLKLNSFFWPAQTENTPYALIAFRMHPISQSSNNLALHGKQINCRREQKSSGEKNFLDALK
jgi:hypothetical protein